MIYIIKPFFLIIFFLFRHIFHFMVNDGITYMCMCDDQFERRRAFAFFNFDMVFGKFATCFYLPYGNGCLLYIVLVLHRLCQCHNKRIMMQCQNVTTAALCTGLCSQCVHHVFHIVARCGNEHQTNQCLLLLHTNMEAGHGGASGRFDYLKDVAREYAFMLALEGIAQ